MRRPIIAAPLAPQTAALGPGPRKPRRRWRAFRRAVVIGIMWAIAVLGMWLLLAGIVGFAHA